MVNSQRHTRMPTSAISAATIAVATPPAHSGPGSILRKEPEDESSGLGIGVVIGAP
jgi:hypothetical protein